MVLHNNSLKFRCKAFQFTCASLMSSRKYLLKRKIMSFCGWKYLFCRKSNNNDNNNSINESNGVVNKKDINNKKKKSTRKCGEENLIKMAKTEITITTIGMRNFIFYIFLQVLNLKQQTVFRCVPLNPKSSQS